MKLKKYWKTVFLAMTGSPGRFWSIVCLLALGSATLFGLKVTGPNLESAGQQVVQSKNGRLSSRVEFGLFQERPN